MKENEITIKEAIQDIAGGCIRPDNGQVTSIGELSRKTGVPAFTILKTLELGVRVNGWVAETVNDKNTVVEVKPSKEKDKIRSEIESEGQRYQRRPQIPPPGSKGKPISGKVEARTRNFQVAREKVAIFIPIESRTEVERNKMEEKERRKREARFAQYGAQPEVEASKSANKLMSILSSMSVASFQRPGRVKELFARSAKEQEPVNMVNWICPPGTPLVANDRGEVFRRYVGVSPEAGFEADYRLLPRLGLEEKLLRAYRRADMPQPDYFKIVADDNPYCLYPLGMQFDGEKPTLEAIEKYSQYVQVQLDQRLGKGQICTTTFSKIAGPQLFGEMLRTFERTSFDDLAPYLPGDVLETELDVLTSHTKPDPKVRPFFVEYAKKVIRQYAVEGLFLYKLFGDDVVLAWNESTRRTAIIDSLRLKNGLPPLPKIFVLHEKRGGQIYENY